VKTHNELMREEFGEGLDHLRMGAAHAAGTAAALLEPRLDQMRERLEPTVDRSKDMARRSANRSADLARDSRRRAAKIARRTTGKKKESRMAKRWPKVIGGLMIAGVAAGFAGAIMSRRRQKKWNDYGSTGPATGFTDEARSFSNTARSTASSVAEGAKDKASDVLGQMKSATESSPTGGSAPQASQTGTRTNEFSAGETFKSGTTTGGASRNARP
jgi:hypothetical protein